MRESRKVIQSVPTHSILAVFSSLLCLFFVILSMDFTMDLVEAYYRGEIIKMTKKIQTQKHTDEWTEVLGHFCPHYGWSRRVSISLLNPEEIRVEKIDTELKISFSFDNDRFITPFFVITDGNSLFLEYLEFTFVFSGDNIVDVTWNTHYNDHDFKMIPNEIILSYRWEEYSGKDITMSISFLLFSNLILAASLILYSVIDSQLKSDSYRQISEK